MDVRTALLLADGIAPVEQLVRRGISARAVQRAAEQGSILRVRRGWYAVPEAHPQRVRAIRVGGALGCVSGAAYWGLWQPWNMKLHVAVPRTARHIKHPDTGKPRPGDDVVLHWTATAALASPSGVLPLEECLAQVCMCQPAEIAFAIIESALRRGRIDAGVVTALAARVPSRAALILGAGSLADSGTESTFAYRMRELGIELRSQVNIDGVGRVDFVIGDRLVIEIDSEAHHGSAGQRMRDLNRDAILAGLGFLCLRFDYRQVFTDWDTVVATVFAVIERGDHLDRRRILSSATAS
jgi:very-short-patch-repair endonuclease